MNATTNPEPWRDLAEKLTPEQVAWLEDFEREPSTERDISQMTLAVARSYVESNEAAACYVDVPAPAGAVVVYDWADPQDESAAFRYFNGTSRTTENKDVEVDGDGIHIPTGASNGSSKSGARTPR
jgi:hypothetical protein